MRAFRDKTNYVYVGDKINVLQEGDTALHLASRLGQRELVEILTSTGADITIVNKVSNYNIIYMQMAKVLAIYVAIKF